VDFWANPDSIGNNIVLTKNAIHRYSHRIILPPPFGLIVLPPNYLPLFQKHFKCIASTSVWRKSQFQKQGNPADFLQRNYEGMWALKFMKACDGCGETVEDPLEIAPVLERACAEITKRRDALSDTIL